MIKQSVPFNVFPSIKYSYALIGLSVEASMRMVYSYILLYMIIIPWMFYFIPSESLYIWLFVAFGLLIFRYIVTKKLSYALEHKNEDVNKYLRWSIYSSLYGGILWGSLGWLNLQYPCIAPLI